MKAIVVNNPFDIEIREVDKPVINNEKDIIIKVISGGICGSDIGIFKGTNSLATYPRIIGHEFAGIVEEVGADVTHVKVGDLVAVDPVSSCGHCHACRVGRYNVCANLDVAGVHRDGGFSEYTKAKEANVYKIDASKISPQDACLVEPYSIGVEANERASVSAGDKVLVMGAGPMGIVAMQVAKARGAEVMITDVLDSRLVRASEMGADRIVNVLKEDIKDAINEISNGEGMYVVIDAVCSVTSIVEALDFAASAGRVVSLGFGSESSEIPPIAISKKGLDVFGSRLNNRRFSEVIKLFESGKATPEHIKTHTYHFTKIAEAFEFIKNNQEVVCKVVITFE